MTTIKSNISDAQLLKDIGLIGRFQLIDVAAQQEGHPAGDAILTAPNKALGQADYCYYIQLVGQQVEISIPVGIYDEYEESVHDIGAALSSECTDFFEEVYDTVTGFYLKAQSLLTAKPVSPTIATLKGTQDNSTEGKPKPVSTGAILHYNDALSASTSQNPISLRDAEFLYQPVEGTKSKYYVICLTTTGLKIAASYKNKILKVRVLDTWYNPLNTEYLKDLTKDFVLIKKTGGHYSSAYLDLTPTQAQRFLWAMLATFDPLHIRTGLPQIEDFKG
ncbi:hypothetical protein NVP1215B_010 [Vibrio phage 1.215.B._10N.222.54.F7]|nr:hypothetical protein NVP1215A_010 [Vibrio phage 1.215.A._10N.222.54.F7]AUR96033.1 hypothetical protein NVP1215B_010 [Vibrio phage 1.215.B._10N.222.54.F7]